MKEEIINLVNTYRLEYSVVELAVNFIEQEVENYRREFDELATARNNGTYLEGFNRGNQIHIYENVLRRVRDISKGDTNYAKSLEDLFKTKVEDYMIPRGI